MSAPSEPENTSDPGKNTEPETADAIAQALGTAAARSGLGALAQADQPNGKVLLEAMGGIRGIFEAVLPGLLFLVVYTIDQNLPLALGISVGVAAIFTVLRLVQKTPVSSALGGLIAAGASAVLALVTNRPEDNFVLGFVTNGVYAAALLISIAVRWPVIGLIAGYLMNEGTAWKRNATKRRVFAILTFCWAGMFLLRLAVQLPLYLSGNVEWLAATKLIMGIPLYAPLLILTWLVVRALYRKIPSEA
ncbi:DUF3159 domain-containing protein [Mycetocola manganoxydans]|uniref:DUF3159 domain-containing protein n=1 Tax=Mycetocola manganoxydans TaxID=699879 RepID=A0A3L6ZYR7_9MICO|nr:DUF3159 domain-containing protein [Mycetocola manganoxydans]RLP72581.1 DUF3159 domain-containing protein [Mycetocola manganoxydans]GHD39682.1 hypothetical protein GCM10008097_02670 [Mycetocola manganoxydans]